MLRTRDIGMTDVWVDGRRTDRYRVPQSGALINNALLQGSKLPKKKKKQFDQTRDVILHGSIFWPLYTYQIFFKAFVCMYTYIF